MSATLDKNHELFAADPDDTRAFDALVEHYYFNGGDDDWGELVALYRHRLTAPSVQGSPKLRVSVLVRLAQLLEERCFDLDKAVEYYTEAATLDPTSQTALSHLRRIYTQRGQWDMVLQIADVESRCPMQGRELAAFHAEMGDIWRDRLGDKDQALECYERAVEADAGHAGALSGLAQTLQSFGRTREAVENLERLVGVLRGEARAPALVELGRLVADAMGELEQAGEYFRRALADDPMNSDAVEALAGNAAAQGHWEQLTELYQRRFDLAAGARARATIAIEAGQHHLHRLDDEQAARTWLDRARELCPEDLSVHKAMVDIARRTGDESLLMNSLEALIDGASADDMPAPSVLLEAANLLSEAGRDQRALAILERAREVSPNDPLILEALSDTLSALGRPSALAEVLEQRIELSNDEPGAKAESLVELGRIYEEDLDDADSAIFAYTRAFQADPQVPGAATRMERLYRKAENWSELRGMLQRATVEGPEGKRARFWTSLGDLLVVHFDDGDGAVAAYESALELEPTRQGALEGLQRIAQSSGDAETLLRAYEREATICSDPDRFQELGSQIARIHREADRPDEALHWVERVLERRPDSGAALREAARLNEMLGQNDELIANLERLDAQLEGAEKCANLHRIASLHIATGCDEAAIGAWESILQTDSLDREALLQLQRAYRATQRWEALATTCRSLLLVLEGSEATQALQELSVVLEEKLGDSAGAIEAIQRLQSTEGGAQREALDLRLEKLLEQTGRIEELVRQLADRRSRMAPDHPDALAVDLQRAELLMRPLADFAQAIEVLHGVRAAHPNSGKANDLLEQALRDGHDTRGLVDLLAERAQVEMDRERIQVIQHERATLLEDVLGETAEARALYEALCREDAESDLGVDAARRLEAILERKQDWPALRGRLEARLSRASDEERLSLHRRIAELCRGRLDDASAWAAHLEAAGALAPQDAEVWQQLASHYEGRGETQDWMRVLEAELETHPSHERELTLRSCLAAIHASDGTSDAAERASAHYEAILELDPGHAEAAEYLIERAERAERHGDVLRLLQIRLDTSSPSDLQQRDARTSLRLRIAGLQSGPLASDREAIATLEDALAETGPTQEIAEPLAALYERHASHGPLIELCRAARRECDGPERAALWARRLGESLRARAEEGDARAAIEAYLDLLQQRPGDRDARQALMQLYRETGDAAPLADMLNEEIARSHGETQLALQLELAQLLAERLGRPEEALGLTQEILDGAPTQREAFELAMKLVRDLGRNEELLKLVELRLGLDLPSVERARLFRQCGDLLLEVLDRPADAVTAYRESEALVPGRREVRASLRAALEGLGRWSEVLDCLYVEARSSEGEARARLLEEAVELTRQQMGDDAALPWLERLRAEKPHDADIAARISDLHRRAGRHTALLRSLDVEAALCRDPQSELRIQIEAGRLLDEALDSPGRALWAFEAARRIAPRDPQLLEKLDELYGRTGRTRDRAEILAARIDVLGDSQDVKRAELHVEAAESWEILGENAAALRHWLCAVSLTPASNPACDARLQRLAEGLELAGATEAQARALEARLALHVKDGTVTRRVEATLRLELARIYSHKLAMRGPALAHLRTLAERVAEHDHESELLTQDELEEMETMLLHQLRVDGNWLELEKQLSARLARTQGSVDEWLELARLRDERLHMPVRATEAYREVIDRQPSLLPGLRGLRQVSERLKDWPEVIRTLSLELEHREDATARERGVLLRRMGELASRRMDDGPRAIEAYRAALEVDREDLESLRALEQLSVESGEWNAALDYYEREIRVLGGREAQRRQEAWLIAGEIALQRCDDPTRAVRAYEQAEELQRSSDNCRLFDARRWREWSELYLATDDLDRYAEVRAHWCDDEHSGAESRDHFELARKLHEMDRHDAALARLERATEVDPTNTEAWDLAADVREAIDDPDGATSALEEAASILGGFQGCRRFVRAAELIHSHDANRALDLLRRATEFEPASCLAMAMRARVAEGLSKWQEAEESAATALDLAEPCDELSESERLETALVGGRAAQAQDRLEPAARLFSQVLAIDAEHREALERQGEVLFQRGDVTSARHVLEKRLELSGDDPNLAHHLVIVGTGLELADQPDDALARFRRALEVKPEFDDAHEGIVRVHESAGRVDEAIRALDTWVEAAGDAPRRSKQLVHAAQLELERGNVERAERHLRDAVEAEPEREHAHTLLATELWEADRREEALEAANTGLDYATSDEARALLALILGRALEEKGEREKAAEAYGLAREHDRECREAALAEARLLRGLGHWQAAADALEDFAAKHPAPQSSSLARVHFKRGQLMAGPLEDMEEAIRSYEQAIQIDPDLTEAREPLASLLVHFPHEWPRAVAHHRTLLAEDPTRAGSLRALLTIATERGRGDEAKFGLAILRAVGTASPEEASEAPASLPMQVGSRVSMMDEDHEMLRQMVQLTRDELETALSNRSDDGLPENATPSQRRFWDAKCRITEELTAPRLGLLPDAELEQVFATLARLALEPDAMPDTPLARSLDQSVGRWTRRKLRKLLEGRSVTDLTGIDIMNWRAELEVLSACTALDRCDGDLRSALTALLLQAGAIEAAEPAESADLGPALHDAPLARRLMVRVVGGWCDTVASLVE